jgi:hypothetical protein
MSSANVRYLASANEQDYFLFKEGPAKFLFCFSTYIRRPRPEKNMNGGTCSLSLWRVGRGSKHMLLELIHGLFIT